MVLRPVRATPCCDLCQYQLQLYLQQEEHEYGPKTAGSFVEQIHSYVGLFRSSVQQSRPNF